jgi:site-specific recombinase XerC
MTSPEENANDQTRTLLGEYEQFLAGKARGTIEAYLRTARHLMGWVARQPGNAGQFQPPQLTQSAVEGYLAHLEQEGLSLPHRARVKSTISNFANFLIEEKGQLQRNPTRGINLPPLPLLAPRGLSPEQRSILHALVEQERDRRGAALFALGYWAGCRVSEVSWLQMAHTHVGPQFGWLHVGQDGKKWRDIDLMNEAREPLYAYLQVSGDTARTYVFTSQRSGRLTEEGIYYWFRAFKAQGARDQRRVIEDITFNNLRHDFGQRAREAGWLPEEVAYYLGDVTRQGAPALQTIVRHTEVSREQVKSKLNDIKG